MPPSVAIMPHWIYDKLRAGAMLLRDINNTQEKEVWVMKKKTPSIVPIVAALVVQICVGILYIWSVLKAPAIAFYGWDAGDANLVASFMLFAFCAGNFGGGFASDRLGPKKTGLVGIVVFAAGIILSSFLPAGSSIWLFYLSYCVIGGIGCGVCYGAMLTCTQRWMPHRRGLATGLSCGAFGLATVIFSPITNALVTAMPFNRALLILGVCFMVVGVGAASLIKLPTKEYLDSLPAAPKTAVSIKRSEDLPLSKAMKTLPFWLLFFGCFFFNGTWNMLSPLIKGLGIERGLTEATAVLCVSSTGIANAAGRILVASLSDKIGRVNSMYIIYSLTVVCAILLSFVTTWGFFAAVMLAAFCYGGPSALNPATTTDFFGIKYAGTNYGIIMMSLGFSSVVFNYISNALYAATGEYFLTFIMGAVTAAISVVIAILINVCIKKQAKAA